MATWRLRHLAVARRSREDFTLYRRMEDSMWRFADRAVKTVADMTLGTVIVLVHVALAERRARAAELERTEPRRLPS